MSIRILMIISLVGAMAILASGGDDRPSEAALAPPPPEVGVYEVRSAPVALTTELPGRVTAFRVAEVRPQVNGIVQKRLFEEGALVTEGLALYQIDSAVYQANYDKALAHLDNTAKAAQRQAALKDRQSLSAQDYENALYAWKQAQADAELARLNLEHCRVTAPLTGYIGRSNITEGSLVMNGQAQPLAVIQQIDTVYVDLAPTVSQVMRIKGQADGETDRAGFAQGAEVTLTLEDGRAYPRPGTIKFLDTAVDQGTGGLTLRVEFPNPDGVLRPGLFVRATVVERVAAEALLVPQQALTRDQTGQALVWVVNGQNAVEKRPVTAERTVGNTWLISAGLADGERVVTEGLQRLAPGQVVVPRAADNVRLKLALNK